METEAINRDEEQESSIPLNQEKLILDRRSEQLSQRIECLWWFWLTCINIYNFWTLIFRQVFFQIQVAFIPYWIILDSAVDITFLYDFVIEVRRIRDKSDSNSGLKKYFRSKRFCLDLICLIPLDFLQFIWGMNPLLRFPRLLKVYKSYTIPKYFMGWVHPNAFRLMNLIHGLVLVTHWKACVIHWLQTKNNFDTHWGYPGTQEKDIDVHMIFWTYLSSFHRSANALLGGETLRPRVTSEYWIITFSPFFSVLVLSVIVAEMVRILNYTKKTPEMDEHTMFGCTLAAELRNLSPKNCSKVYAEITRIMRNIEQNPDFSEG